MAADPKFQDRLDRAIALFVQETTDGCVDCVALGEDSPCHEHEKLFADLVLHPRKYITLRAKKHDRDRP